MDMQELFARLGIDRQACLDRFSGNEGLYLRFLLRFPQDPTWEQLCQAWEAGDTAEEERAAHTLKGIAANLGLGAVYTSSAALVEALRAGQAPALPGLRQQLRADCEEARALLAQVAQ